MGTAEPDRTHVDRSRSGAVLHAFVRELFPVCRSITGDGLRATYAAIGRRIPLELLEIPSGTRAFDWEIPQEWAIRDAYVTNASGERVIDFRRHSLHVVGYSTPVDATMSLAELRPHLHTLPEHPDWIPYRTSYYRPDWGFCLRQRELDAMPPGDYRVRIDSELFPGSLTLAECFVPGTTSDEVLIYTHACHPSLANDNLSALAVATELASRLLSRDVPGRHGYRFVFGPATIGSVAWLARNEQRLANVKHGLVLANLGDRGPLTFKRSRRGSAPIDGIAEHVLRWRGGRCEDFSPYGYDERQFCSPGFDLPLGRLTRTPNGAYPEYHTSADDLEFVAAESLADSLDALEEIVDIVERNAVWRNLNPKCEPRLGPRGLFRLTGGRSPDAFEHAVLWTLNQSDGTRDLLAIANRAGMRFAEIDAAARALHAVGLLAAAEPAAPIHATVNT